MSSMLRTLQKRILSKAGVLKVPVYVEAKKKRRLIGFRHRLCAAHISYMIDGTPELAAPPKPKRKRGVRSSPVSQVAA